MIRVEKLSKAAELELYRDSLFYIVSAIFCQIFIFLPNDSPLKTMKNVFYFILKAFFVLEMFKFL